MAGIRGDQRKEGPEVSLFPFLAVLLCTMGMLIMLLVLISRDTKDRDDERLALRGTTGTQTGSDSNSEEDLFSVEAFNEFQKRAEERSEESDDESSLPIDPSLKSPNDPKSETVSESKPEPEDGKTDDLSEISPEESAEIDSLFEEYHQIYGEMSAEEIESQRETADWF